MISSCLTCKKEFKYYQSNKSGIYCSVKCVFANKAWREKNKLVNLGRKHSPKSRLKMSKARKGIKQSETWIKNRFASFKDYWDKKGRVTDKLILIKTSNEYKEWRKRVFERDNYQCVWCGDKKGGNLEADHVIPIGVIMLEKGDLFDVDNGRTLCITCHKTTFSYAKHTKKQLEGKVYFNIQKLWEQKGSTMDFESFYRTKLEGIIENLKTRLD